MTSNNRPHSESPDFLRIYPHAFFSAHRAKNLPARVCRQPGTPPCTLQQVTIAIARIQKRNDSLIVAPEQFHNFLAPKHFRITTRSPTGQLMRVFRDLIIFRENEAQMRNNCRGAPRSGRGTCVPTQSGNERNSTDLEGRRTCAAYRPLTTTAGSRRGGR
jgi:hypothetical protein